MYLCLRHTLRLGFPFGTSLSLGERRVFPFNLIFLFLFFLFMRRTSGFDGAFPCEFLDDLKRVEEKDKFSRW